MQQCVATTGADPGIVEWILQHKYKGKKLLRDLTTDEKVELCNEAEEQQVALIVLCGADQSKYGPLLEELENDYLNGQNNYPCNITGVYNWLLYWSNEACIQSMCQFTPTLDGTNFAQHGNAEDAGSSVLTQKAKKNKRHITCFQCGEQGHYASKCKKEEEMPRKQSDAQQHLTAGVVGPLDEDSKINFVFVMTGMAVQLFGSGGGGYDIPTPGYSGTASPQLMFSITHVLS